MGTYTTNYNLFMPSIGEQGWGELVNGNFTTIDTTLKGLNTRMGTAESNITSLTTRMGTAETTIASNKSRIGTLETETDAIEGKVTKLEAGEFETVTANELCGKRVGVPTTTAPTPWSVVNKFSNTFSFMPTSSVQNQVISKNVSMDGFVYWDMLSDIGETVTYTITYKPDSINYYLKSFSITFTNYITGAVITNNYTAGTSSKNYTVSAPLLANVSVTGVHYQWGLGVNNSSPVTISRPNVYIKPKGT